MKLLVYSAKEFEIPYLKSANQNQHKITFVREALDSNTAVLAVGQDAISIFSGDDASSVVLEILKDMGVKYIATRSVGYNNINLKASRRLGLKVANTPNYSPYSIAEHALALLLTLSRKIVLADRQIHSNNFKLNNLKGTTIHGKTVGIIGTGNIGRTFAKIINGFGCTILAYDIDPDYDLVQFCNLKYVDLEELFHRSDIISLHIPLTYDTRNFIDERGFSQMKKNVILINTARGEVVDTKSVIKALETGKIAAYATDVYEKERGIFFKDNSVDGIKDDQLKKLITMPNTLITPHQAFMTEEALKNIAAMTLKNIDEWANEGECRHELGKEYSLS